VLLATTTAYGVHGAAWQYAVWPTGGTRCRSWEVLLSTHAGDTEVGVNRDGKELDSVPQTSVRLFALSLVPQLLPIDVTLNLSVAAALVTHVTGVA
jgi:hypothetical protein